MHDVHCVTSEVGAVCEAVCAASLAGMHLLTHAMTNVCVSTNPSLSCIKWFDSWPLLPF